MWTNGRLGGAAAALVAGCGFSASATGSLDANDASVTDAALDTRAAADAQGDASPACLVAPSSMVGWWSGDGDMSDRVGGHTGVSGTQNSATSVGFGAGKLASAFDLRGASYVQIANAPELQLEGSITIEAWIYATALGGRILDKITAGTAAGFLLDTYQGKVRLIVGNATISSGATLPTSTWVHVAGTYDGASLSVFINGTLAGSTPHTAAIPVNTLAVRIGADSDGRSRFDGKLDEVVLYDRALSPAELVTIATSTLERCL